MKTLVLAAALVAFSSPAFANSCPLLMGDIDKALQTASLDAAKKDQVTKLRASGEAKHKSGDHAGSMRDLQQAKELLGIK